MKSSILTLIFFLISNWTIAQQSFIKATVCDSASKQSLPSASIKLKNTKIGTSSNEDGVFSIKPNGPNATLQISYIGYKTKEIAAKLVKDTIFVAEDNLLSEIVIMPDSALKVFLKNAYNNISKNYPQEPTYLTGFYREVLKNKAKNTFSYFTESFLKVYKPAYNSKSKDYPGQINVLKARTIKNPEYAQSGTKYMGGPYIPINGDLVFKRDGAVNPENFKKYNFEIEKITKYDNQQVYIVKYSAKDSTVNGRLFINKEDMAYVKIERTASKLEKDSSLTKKTNYTLLYDKKEKLYYLKMFKLEIERDVKKQDLTHWAEFVTTSFDQDSVKAFTYSEQLLPTDIIADTKSDLTDNFFNGFDASAIQTNELKNQVNSVFNVNTIDSLKNAKLDTLNKTAVNYKSKSRFNYKDILIRSNLFLPGLGFVYAPLVSYNATYEANINTIFKQPVKTSRSISANYFPLLFSYYWTYKLSKRFVIQFNTSKSILSDVKIKQDDIGLAYRLVLNRGRKPLYVEPNIKYGFGKSGLNLGSFENPDKSIVIDGEKFNSKKLIGGIFQKNKSIKLGANVAVYSGRFLKAFPMKLYLQVDYQHIINKETPYFQLIEKGLFAKKLNLPLTDSRLDIKNVSDLKLPELKGNFWIGFSYRIVM
jgi:CarboxypepD_reg-like domain